MTNASTDGAKPTVEWHDTPQIWVAYDGCGCQECPKGYGKTEEEAIADLLDATSRSPSE
jgi:hypothetical protein